MAYKLYGRQVFEAEVNGKKYTFTCYSQNTSYGFTHVCTEGYNNTTERKWIRNRIIATELGRVFNMKQSLEKVLRTYVNHRK